MAMKVKDIRAWLDTLYEDDEVGIDEGGLTLELVCDSSVYLEVGGIEDEEDEQ